MRGAVLAALSAAAAGAAVDVDLARGGGHVYDGHGGLSAGASSRLLYDYPEPQRSQVLDYLFRPKFGANLHHLKVEIGGDSQSTDGTEASHMHTRSDLDCNRGYEWWLLEEARRRNPKVQTFALSWAVPHWIGNDTYYSADNIDYHVKWLQCVQDKHPDVGNIDYMGVWNERQWGNPTWIKEFRSAMDAAGFKRTRIIIPDGRWSQDILTDMDADKDFAAAVEGVGLHYPCHNPHPEVQRDYGKKYWSSEDYSTEGTWTGAGCWGRLLNQNYVRMNMTSTISWGLIWSVYDDWPYFGNGLMYAMTPWSGYYSNMGPIWVSAHTEQFTEVGWRYVPGAAGMLEKGGSVVALASPDGADFTVVLEKLEGSCLRCAGQTTKVETVSIRISGDKGRHTKLAHWTTNETHQFVRAADVPVGADGTVTVECGKDSIVTLSTIFDAAHGTFSTPIPPQRDFPLPYSDDFEGRSVGSFPAYFSDNGGSFELSADPAAPGRQALKQAVTLPPMHNHWVNDVEPITVLGNKSWDGLDTSVKVYIPSGGASQQYVRFRSELTGQCIDVRGKGGAGTAVDTWTCVSDYNERFWLDPSTGHLVEHTTGNCVTAAKCGGSELCTAVCSAAAAANQTWTFNASGGAAGELELKGTGRCVTVASSALKAPLSLQPCGSAGKGALWTRTSPQVYAGVCHRVLGGGFAKQKTPALCLQLFLDGSWAVGDRMQAAKLAAGRTGSSGEGRWVTLRLAAANGLVNATVDGAAVATAVAAGTGAGRVALVSGWNVAYFDDFQVRRS
eukprot:TRINITY_DN2350_c2_g1_i1.p1 TRINITY_DN2350_c2_g1~~TRINITY_DN2350_c2_g1_i1.p1  ORF type:complete len:808 (+),score=197.48 TRINITY_DN2350_c2_g1_i1:73-2424(+)